MLGPAQARSAAEMLWGEGGTEQIPTTRPGAYYFSCSGHGGFIIDGQALTGGERGLLREAGFAAGSPLWDGRPDLGGAWAFEEDGDWAAVYALTGIRTPDRFAVPEGEVVRHALASLRKLNPRAAAVADRVSRANSLPPGASSAAPPARPAAGARRPAARAPARRQPPPGARPLRQVTARRAQRAMRRAAVELRMNMQTTMQLNDL